MTQPPHGLDLAAARDRVAALSLPQTTIQSAELLPAGPFTPPGASAPIAHLPPFCRIRGTIEPQISFEVWLPTDRWNGRFQGVGNGGLAGVISYDALGRGVSADYATVSTDTGHQGSTDALWAIGHPELVEDYGHRAVHEMTVKGKAITQSFYGEAARRAYWVGCSTGGRQGLMEAQRYPDDYDGILAGAPAINISTFHAHQLWAAQSVLLDPDSRLNQEQLDAVNRAVLDAWDAADGVQDGVIEDPRSVQVDFAAVQKAAGLNNKQVEALRRVYQGPVTPSGESVHPGLMPGSESLWSQVIGGPNPSFIATSIYGQMLKQRRDWDWQTFDYDADVKSAQQQLRDNMDAMNPDLSAFQTRGGKLILYHGWSDPQIPPEGTRRYYEQVVQTMGGQEATQQFARLFMLPGMGHCRGGSGPDTFAGLPALVDWVENGTPPGQLIAARIVDGVVQRTRPLCPYPQTAHYSGSGSTDEAANFDCA